METLRSGESTRAQGARINARKSRASIFAICAAVASIAAGCTKCGCDDGSKEPTAKTEEPDLAQVQTYNYGDSPSQERGTTDGGLGVVRSFDYGDRPPETRYPKSCETADGRLVPEPVRVGTMVVSSYNRTAFVQVNSFHDRSPFSNPISRRPDEILGIGVGISLEEEVDCGKKTWLEIDYSGDSPDAHERHLGNQNTVIGAESDVEVDFEEFDERGGIIGSGSGNLYWIRGGADPAHRFLSFKPHFHESKGAQRGK